MCINIDANALSLGVSLPKPSEKYIETSRLVLDQEGNYICVDEKPYLLNAIQIKPALAVAQFRVTTDTEYTEYIEPFFKNSADMGYNTVIFGAKWRHIEETKDQYDFSMLKRFYDYARKYNLYVQLLWFGSDACGYEVNMPDYILDDTETYSRLKKYPKIIDYGNINLLEREMNVFGKLLEWLYENDTDRRTIMLQIENEPNFRNRYGPKRRNNTDIDSIEECDWCTGQRREIWKIMNTLGLMVKRGPYRCVTRVNLATPNYYFNGVKNGDMKELIEMGGIDIVGLDSYQEDPDVFLLEALSFEGNVPHWPEYGAYHQNYVPAMLNALSRRAGVFGYALKAVVDDTIAIIDNIENDWTWPTGEKIDNREFHRVDAYELQALNTVLNKASSQIALNNVRKTHVFNLVRDTRCREFTDIDGVQINFTNDGADGFGGCGYVTMISDNEMLVFATRGNSTFRFSGRNLALVQIGFFEANTWITRDTIPVLENTITVTSDMALKGTLIRVTFN